MNLWFVLAINSITLGGLLFLLSAGFSLIFGLMKIPNLTHGSFFMLGAYLATSLLARGFDFWTAAVAAGLLVAALGGIVERLILRRLPGAELAQVLVTLGLSFMIADACLMVWTGDPIQVATPGALRGATSIGWLAFPTYRLAIAVIAVVFAAGLWALLDRTRLGAMIRAGVDDPEMARVTGIRVSRLFTIVFCLGAWLAGFAGVIGGPLLSLAPRLAQEMLPRALVVVLPCALGINVLVGYAGLVTLGHAGLFGIAAYAAARIMNNGHDHVAVAAGAIALTLAAAAVFAVLALRGTGLGFVMITVALGQIVWGIAYRWISITNGDNGISIKVRPSPLGLSLASPAAFYWATLVVFLVAVASMALFVASPFGASVRGTRDQSRRMNALGYHVWMIRFLAFLFSAFWSGVAGVLFLYYNQFVSPHVVALTVSAEALFVVIAGGTATLLGPIAGAALGVIIKNVGRAHLDGGEFMVWCIVR